MKRKAEKRGPRDDKKPGRAGGPAPESEVSAHVDVAEKELSAILDIPAIQSLMEDFTRLTGMATALLDLKGNVLIATGWQDICTKFHRVHPESRRDCTESDLYLARNVKAGEYVAYKCKNQLWDIVTPLHVGGKHVGNIYTGQFFYEDDPADAEPFMAQAAKYGFDKESYLSALRRVPHVSREKARNTMSFLSQFAELISRMGYSNLKLSAAIAEQERVEAALRESESRLLAIANYTYDWENWVDPHGKLVWINPAVERITGYTVDECLAMTDFPLPFFDEEDREEAAAIFADAVQKKTTENDVELHMRCKDGSLKWVALSWQPIYDSHGISMGHRSSVRDIDERKKIEEELRIAYEEMERRVQERTFQLTEAYAALQREVDERRKTEEQLRHSQKMEAIGTLAGGIAHDFNNILAAIIGFTEMVLDDTPPENPTHRKLGFILKSSIRGRDLVRQILAFSRKTDFARTPQSVSTLITETVQLVRASLPSTIEISVNMKVTSDMVNANPAEIQQIIMNLSTNAAYAMQKEGGTMTITLNDLDIEGSSAPGGVGLSRGAYLQLTVRDTGVGMDPDVMKRIFDPFFTTKDVGLGTGMGLAVVYGIVKSLGGDITVESTPGLGTIFRVLLPKAAVDAPELKTPVPEIQGGRERILFIDDEDVLVAWGKDALTRLGYEVTASTDSVKALKSFSEDPSRFDLVLTDQTMPKITGLRLAEEVLMIRPDIPIILCTGHSDAVSPEVAKMAGIREFLMKPLVKHELAQAIRRALEGKSKK